EVQEPHAIWQERGPRVVELAARNIHLGQRRGNTARARHLPQRTTRTPAPAPHDDVAARAPASRCAPDTCQRCERFWRATGHVQPSELASDDEAQVATIGRPEGCPGAFSIRHTLPS